MVGAFCSSSLASDDISKIVSKADLDGPHQETLKANRAADKAAGVKVQNKEGEVFVVVPLRARVWNGFGSSDGGTGRYASSLIQQARAQWM